MPYFDENGNEVEGLLTQEELDAKIAEERDTLTKEHEEAQSTSNERIIQLEADKRAAQAAVDSAAAAGGDDDKGEGGDKDTNLAGLRKKLEETSAALEEEREQNKERYTKLENDRIDAAIKAVAGDDEDMANKIRHNYDNMLSAVKAETSEEITQKVLSAAKLSADPDASPNPLDIARAGGNRGVDTPTPSGEKAKPFNSNELASGKMMGISDADREKYANDPRMKNTK